MTRIIGDKLDFLMRVTETKNNVLGKAIAFDPSYISRIRTGARGVPKHREFIYPTAAFFVQAIQTEAQKKALVERICPGRAWPEDANAAIALIADWLKEDMERDAAFDRHFNAAASLQPSDSAAGSSPKSETEYFFGNAGKRECVLRFLTELAALNEPPRLLLHSDEDMLWLYEDPNFVKSWAILLKTILQKGSRIVIVHTVQRTLEEMLEAIAKWLPLYATGRIEPYYCPRLRDNIFKRTLFIGSGKAAIFSHTMEKTGKNRLNVLLHDTRVVEALEKEFHDFLAMCRPLMKIYNSSNFAQITKVLTRFPSAKSRTLQFHETPSWLSMPEAVAKSLARHPGCELFYDYMVGYRNLLFLKDGKQAGPVTDIISLPDISTVKDGLAPIPLADVFGLPALCYTGEEFRQHLAAALHRFKTSSDYTVALHSPDTAHPASRDLSPRTFSVIANETAGVILYRSYTPSTLFYMQEQNMTISFCEYLEHFEKAADSREVTMEKLQRYLDELDAALQQDRIPATDQAAD